MHRLCRIAWFWSFLWLKFSQSEMEKTSYAYIHILQDNPWVCLLSTGPENIGFFCTFINHIVRYLWSFHENYVISKVLFLLRIQFFFFHCIMFYNSAFFCLCVITRNLVRCFSQTWAWHCFLFVICKSFLDLPSYISQVLSIPNHILHSHYGVSPILTF